MSYTLEDKVALVTGGAVGIGQATAIALAQAGAQVVIADINKEAGTATVKQIQATGGRALFVQADMADPQQITQLFEQIQQQCGRLDCAVNNAGQVHGFYPLTECPQEAWDRTLLVNLTAVWWCMQQEIRQMLQQGQGAIVNMASGFGLVGFAEHAPYVVSKHGVVGLTRSAALEYAARGIRVNAICPGLILTPLIDSAIKVQPAAVEQIQRMHPIGRPGQPREIADLASFLCSEQASFMTGSIIATDGGFTAQ